MAGQRYSGGGVADDTSCTAKRTVPMAVLTPGRRAYCAGILSSLKVHQLITAASCSPVTGLGKVSVCVLTVSCYFLACASFVCLFYHVFLSEISVLFLSQS
jgi:hypothetical protein